MKMNWYLLEVTFFYLKLKVKFVTYVEIISIVVT
jgi:hypothetical protein